MKALNAEEINVGKKITVLEWEPFKDGTRDGSWKGDVLTVLAVDLPYIIASFDPRNGHPPHNTPHTFDTRKTHFAEPSEDYVRLYTSAPENRTQAPQQVA